MGERGKGSYSFTYNKKILSYKCYRRTFSQILFGLTLDGFLLEGSRENFWLLIRIKFG